MAQGSVLIATEKISQFFYRSLHLSNEQIVIVPLQDAGEALQRSIVDLILLDCGLKLAEGLRLLKKAKSLNADVPVLFLTDVSSETAVVEAFNAGARQYFKKPVCMEELKAAMKSLLRMKRECHEKRAPLFAASAADLRACIHFVTSDLPPNIVNAIDYIEEHVCAGVSLDALARKANLSKYYFCRLFKQYAGMTPMRLVMCLRIRLAEELLRRGGCPVSMVAYEVGFKNCGSFNRQFKNHTRKTPTRYRINASRKALGNTTFLLRNKCKR